MEFISDKGFQRIAKEVKDNLPGGLGDNKPSSDFNADQLKKGIKVEMEHTDDPKLAEEIAKDHLTEDSRYYDKLEKMEKNSMIISDKGFKRIAQATEKKAIWFDEDEFPDDEDLDVGQQVEQFMEDGNFPQEGLNADWSVSVWDLGKGKSLIDTETGSWEIVEWEYDDNSDDGKNVTVIEELFEDDVMAYLQKNYPDGNHLPYL